MELKPQTLQFKKLVFLPSDHIAGGYVSYNLDDKTGIITYQGELDASVVIAKQIPFSGTEKVDPSELLSANLKVGQEFKVGAVSLKVASIANGKGVADVIYVDGMVNAKGQAALDMSQPVLSVEEMSATGTVKYGWFSFDVTLVAKAI